MLPNLVNTVRHEAPTHGPAIELPNHNINIARDCIDDTYSHHINNPSNAYMSEMCAHPWICRYDNEVQVQCISWLISCTYCTISGSSR